MGDSGLVGLLRAGEVCRDLGVPPSTLRLYSKRFSQALSTYARVPQHGVAGTRRTERLYTAADVSTLRQIRDWLQAGKSVAQVEELLGWGRAGVDASGSPLSARVGDAGSVSPAGSLTAGSARGTGASGVTGERSQAGGHQAPDELAGAGPATTVGARPSSSGSSAGGRDSGGRLVAVGGRQAGALGWDPDAFGRSGEAGAGFEPESPGQMTRPALEVRTARELRREPAPLASEPVESVGTPPEVLAGQVAAVESPGVGARVERRVARGGEGEVSAGGGGAALEYDRGAVAALREMIVTLSRSLEAAQRAAEVLRRAVEERDERVRQLEARVEELESEPAGVPREELGGPADDLERSRSGGESWPGSRSGGDRGFGGWRAWLGG
ncbi:MAG: MerR family transcriptional regulator [Chloroflexi bacterium]|nr:MerR family transcriptional regulator [Chloroflexota bacterium]